MAKRIKIPKKHVAIISVIILVCLAVVFSAVYSCYFKKTAASGVKICGVDIGGMTRAEAGAAILEKAAGIDTDIEIEISYKQETVILDFSESSVSADIEASLNKAFEIGKTEGVAKRLSDIIRTKLSGKDFEFALTIEKDWLNSGLEPILKIVPNLAEPSYCELSDDEIIVFPGTEGNLPDYNKLTSDISARLFGREKGKIVLEITETSYGMLTAEEIYSNYYAVMKNAEYVCGENGDITVSPHSIGVDFDVKSAQKLLDKADGKKCCIPADIVRPEVTTEDLSSRLYTDELSSYTSTYAVGNTGRNTNLELACSKLDGATLMPGEVFSYVGTVGHGTYEEGYVDAAVYSGGEITTGVAGGICQGSSTLYSAVLFADLEVVERINHSMPVGYVPRGMDATIATPYIDFKFKNSTGYPIKISAVCSGGLVDIRLLGFDEHPEKEVEITNKLISTIPFETKEIEVEGMAEGDEKIKQNGDNGSVIETYKTIKINGVEESTKLISTSRYDPITQIVEIPPKPEEEEKPGEQTEESTEETEIVSWEESEELTETPEITVE